MRSARAVRYIAACVIALWGSCQAGAWGRAWLDDRTESSSFKPQGEGFHTFSTLLTALGRQYVRRDVRLTLEAAFAERHRAAARRVFVLGDTGLRSGGRLWPHHSHQHRLSVDIFLPLVDAANEPIQLSHQPWNLWGYCQHFDETGRYAGTRWEAVPHRLPLLGRTRPCLETKTDADAHIDFDETARLIDALQRQARLQKLAIRSIILAPEYLPRLLETQAGQELRSLVSKFVTRPVWIRHDEHLHVEFDSR